MVILEELQKSYLQTILQTVDNSVTEIRLMGLQCSSVSGSKQIRQSMEHKELLVNWRGNESLNELPRRWIVDPSHLH